MVEKHIFEISVPLFQDQAYFCQCRRLGCVSPFIFFSVLNILLWETKTNVLNVGKDTCPQQEKSANIYSKWKMKQTMTFMISVIKLVAVHTAKLSNGH